MEIRVQKVNFSYNRQSSLILEDVNVKIHENKINGVIGNNGSGKTTLLHLLGSKYIPNKGKILFDKLVLSRRSSQDVINDIQTNIGYLPQNLDDSISSGIVRDEIISYLDDKGDNLENIDMRINEIFACLGISNDYLNEYLYLLSSGTRRQVALASVLIYNPSVIILDEPTIGLDNTARKNLINYLTRLKKISNKTIIIASNDIDFINKISDEIIILKDGKVIKSENKTDIFKDVNFFVNHDLSIPQIIEFENIVLQEKNIRLGVRDELNDLVKDILRKQ